MASTLLFSNTVTDTYKQTSEALSSVDLNKKYVVRKTLETIKTYEAQGIKTILFVVGQKGVTTLKRKCKGLNFNFGSKQYLDLERDY